MFTLRFESDALGRDSHAITFMTTARSFRANRHPDGYIDVMVENDNGVEIAHPISDGPGAYHRCFVMNEHGKTVAKFSAVESAMEGGLPTMADTIAPPA